MLPRSLHASPDNTLDYDKLPDSDYCLLDVPIDDGPGQGWRAFRHILFACATCWLAQLLTVPREFLSNGSSLISYFIMLYLTCVFVSWRNPRSPWTVLVTDFVLIMFVPFVPRPIHWSLTLLAICFFASSYTLHFCYLRSAAPCLPEDVERVRRRLAWKIAGVLLSMPLLFPYYLTLALWHWRQTCAAFVSFLTYNADNIRAGGIFQSPAGWRFFRVLTFQWTIMLFSVAAACLGFGAPTPPEFLDPLSLAVHGIAGIVCLLPVLVTLAVAAATLAPFQRLLAEIGENDGF